MCPWHLSEFHTKQLNIHFPVPWQLSFLFQYRTEHIHAHAKNLKQFTSRSYNSPLKQNLESRHITHSEVLLQQLEGQIQPIPVYFYYTVTFFIMFTLKYSDRKQPPDYKKNQPAFIGMPPICTGVIKVLSAFSLQNANFQGFITLT